MPDLFCGHSGSRYLKLFSEHFVKYDLSDMCHLWPTDLASLGKLSGAVVPRFSKTSEKNLSFSSFCICTACNLDFEHGIDGWKRTGTVFNNQPTFGDNPTARNRGQPSKHQGDWWIGGYENRSSNAKQQRQEPFKETHPKEFLHPRRFVLLVEISRFLSVEAAIWLSFAQNYWSTTWWEVILPSPGSLKNLENFKRD